MKPHDDQMPPPPDEAPPDDRPASPLDTLRTVADQAEAATLGALLLGGDVDACAAQIADDVDAWGRDAHRLVWAAITDVHDAGGQPDTVAVLDRLRRGGHVDTIGGPAALADLAAAAPAPSQAHLWAEKVADAAQRRRTYRAAQRLLRDVQDPTVDPWDTLERLGSVNGDGPTSGDVLEFLTLRELSAKVDTAGPRSWMLRHVWPQADYGVHSAPEKGQKTWTADDMAISVASGTPWLGHVPVDTAGPVVLFVGEGGEANTVRRLQGLAAERGLDDVLDLPIHICARAPHLDDKRHMVDLARKIRDVQPALVVVDPLYLAARGAELGNLYSMGAMLEGVQHVCQQHGASLLLVHHANRTGRTGSRSISGAGPAEWGRVLITAEVKAKRTDPATMETDTTTVLSIIGGEVADQTIRVRRRIRKQDPDDLDSPFHIVTEAEPADTKPTGSSDPEANLPPASEKLLDAARTDPDRDWTGSALVDLVASEHGHGLKRETVSRSLNDMERAGLFTSEAQGPFEETIWRLVPRVTSRDQNGDHATKDAESSRDSRDVTRDHHTAEAPVTRVTSPPMGGVTQSRDSDHTTATCTSCGVEPPMPYPPPRHAGLCLACAEASQEASA